MGIEAKILRCCLFCHKQLLLFSKTVPQRSVFFWN